MRPFLSLILAALSLSACGVQATRDYACSEMRFGVGDASLVQVSQAAAPADAPGTIADNSMAEMFAKRLDENRAQAAPTRRRAAPPPVRVALLSSGGQWGAFSAGFMNGWSRNRVEPRPAEFDVVTGVSTGALMAPFVFAGPAYDDVLRDLYYGIDESAILRRRQKIELLTAPSIWDPAPLEREVNRQLTDELIALIGEQAASRSLLVGSVNLRSGFFEAFDLTSMAASANPTQQDCLREGLLASAAIPVAFPPRRIDGDLYVDGATRQGLFLENLAQLRVRPEIYVFVNSAVAFPDEDPEFRLSSLVGRSSAIATDELLRQSTIEAVLFAKDQGWRVRGAVAPSIWPGPDCVTRQGDKTAFCASFTKELYEAGFDQATAGPIDWLDADGLIAEMRAQSATARGANR